ncbi:hypothetical protein H1W00_12350 [Aeromicrobium sp. Marseille-Q0843]|uniref:Uncharacterized protein n=1 Tax=Aeromicrobium phoceense TaxID=2754045 RepID=A0A838XGT8_9ACTN|nr:hypothetical protein [Aeromicrobium phoceense]MBA4609272.1 hypothetical protein [Aeromicrobium phoceense]
MADRVGDVFAVTRGLIDVPVPHGRDGRETKDEAESDKPPKVTSEKPGVVGEVEWVHASDS